MCEAAFRGLACSGMAVFGPRPIFGEILHIAGLFTVSTVEDKIIDVFFYSKAHNAKKRVLLA